MEDELKTAWDSATSVPPSESCGGRYVGQVEKNGRIYDFYAVDGGYRYISYAKGDKRR